jgi:hypothetical protein
MIAKTSKFLLCVAALTAALAPEVNAIAPAGRYVVSNGTVKDTKTGLTWQQQITSNVCWAAASSYCSAQSGGWRLPTARELLTLFDYSASTDPMIDLTAFPNTPDTLAGIFWSSTQVGGDSSTHVEVCFTTNIGSINAIGFNDSQATSCALSARCVR